MKRFEIWIASALFFAVPSETQAVPAVLNSGAVQVVATISISQQQMFLEVTDQQRTEAAVIWEVSTGKPGLDTPLGAFRPTWLDADHKSGQYEDSPMPYAVFFSGGYAVHATEVTRRLGTPASHGCVRLAPANAETFFRLVATFGVAHTLIVITE